MLGHVRNILASNDHIFINSRSHDLPIHKEEVEKSIVDKFRALSGCYDPLVLRLFSINGKIDFQHKDLFHQTHVNNLVHLNRNRCFYKMLFKQSHKRMGVVVREPTPIEVPKDMKHTMKRGGCLDDTQEALAFNIDVEHYMELSAKPVLELEEKLELKKYNLGIMEWTLTRSPPSLSRPVIGRSQGLSGIILSRPYLPI